MKKNWIAITLGVFGLFASSAQGMGRPTIGEIVKGGLIPEAWDLVRVLGQNPTTQSLNAGENFVENLRAALASTSPQMLALQTSLTDQGYDASGRDLTHKKQVTAALASQQKLTEQGYDASGTDLTHKKQVTAALDAQQKLTDQGYDASSTDLTHKKQVTAALASQQKLTDQGYDASGSDLTHKKQVTAALASQRKLNDQGYDASGNDLTHKKQVTAALASQQKLTEQGYDASGSDLTHKDQVTAALASQQKLTEQGYDASGSDLTHKNQVTAALDAQRKLAEQGYSSDGHDLISLNEYNQLSERAVLLEQAISVNNIMPNVWTAILASSLLTRDVVSYVTSENLLLSDEDIANHHNSGGSNPKNSSELTALDKAKLLRSWIMRFSPTKHTQSDLDNFQIHLTDGDFYLGTNSGDPDHSLHLKLS